jgi:hypothetical protein
MTGFIRGLFGGKKDNNTPAPKVERSSDAFFLDTDQAKTLGDVNYMRATKTIRRTYPKTVNNEDMEVIKKISSSTARQIEGRDPRFGEQSSATASSNGAGNFSANGASNSFATKADQTEERRKVDTNLDMFRNMAKEIRKG